MTIETMEAVLDSAPADLITHLARCAGCDFAVRFKPSASGASFVLVDSDQALGIGDHGRPQCPNGHGEMEVADDQLPIEQAIEQVDQKIRSGHAAARLPFPAPPFNYEGALHEIFEKQKAVAILEGKFNDADDRRKKAKAALDDGHSELSALIETLQEREEDRLHEIGRREAAAAAGHPEDTNLVRCAWEQAHPDEDCPICEDLEYATAHGYGDTARDSSLHIDTVDRMLRDQETDEIHGLVEDAGIRLSAESVNAWSVEDRAIVKGWAEAETGLADKPEGHARPPILGTAHIAAEPGDEKQSCKECGAVLLADAKDNDTSFYAVGTLVGTDCPGAAKEPARYPGKRGSKKSAK